MLGLLTPQTKPNLVRRPALLQQASNVAAAASVTVTMPRPPSRPLLILHASNAVAAAYNAGGALTGYTWDAQVEAGPGPSWCGCGLSVGYPTPEVASGTAISMTGNGSREAGAAFEMANFLGETIWASTSWTGGGTVITIPAPGIPSDVADNGLLLVCCAAQSTGTAGTWAVTGATQLMTAGNVSSTLSLVWAIYWLRPGQRPGAVFTAGAAGNHSAFAALVR